VLFISEKNPSGLKVDGEIETDRVSLKWLPPYDDVKKYNIYMTKNKSGKYEVIDSTKDKTITLKNLTSNTTYYLLVTSVDRSDYESSPSNELKIITKNISPDKPEITSYGDIKADERKIIWNASTDPDGKVEKYKIYGTKDDKREMIAEIKKPEYILKKALEYKRVEITAVDNNGAESDSSDVKLLKNTVIGFYPGVLIPLGNFGDISGLGYGGTVSLTKRNFFINNLEAGISAGFYYLPGKENIGSDIESIQSTGRAFFIPLSLNAGYRFTITEKIDAVPYLSAGGAYLDMIYTERDSNSLLDKEKRLMGFGPTAGAGVSFEYQLSDTFFIGLRSEFGLMINKEIFDYQFMRIEVSAGYKI
jgi:hypothetical protein